MNGLLRHSLDNGLRIIGEPMGGESVALCFVVLAGSQDETASDAWGTAHALEHMLFKGTQQRDNLHLLEALAQIGAEVNAATSSSATIYYIQVLSEYLEYALSLFSEMIAAPLLEECSWETERAAILNELAESEELPVDILFTLMSRAYFGDHVLGHGILGTHESLTSLNVTQIQRFWKEHYRPNRMLVSVVGSFEETSLCRMVVQHCGTWQSGVLPCYKEPRVGTGQTISVLCKPCLQLQYLMLGVPAIPPGTPGYRAAVLGTRVLSKRLYWAMMQTGLVEDYDVDLWAEDVDILNNANLLALQASCDPAHVKEVLRVMYQELACLFQKGITEEELRRVKNVYVSDLVVGAEERLGRAWDLMEQWIKGQVLSVEEEVARIEEITCEEIVEALARGAVGAKPILVAVGPLDEVIVSQWRQEIWG